MPPARWRLARSFVGFVPTLLTFAVLVAVFIWGIHSGWRVPGLGGAAQKTEKEEESSGPAMELTVNEETNPPIPSTRARLEFKSAEQAEKMGWKFEEARSQPLTRYVHADGMVGYDPEAYSQLPARAAGILFWGEKQVGQPVAKGETLALVESAEIGRAKADLLASLTRLELQSRNLAGLRSVDVTSERTLRETEAAVEEARVKLASDKQALVNFGLEPSLDRLRPLTPEQRIERLVFLGIPPELLGKISQQTRSANLLPVVCPFDGVVVKRNVALGESVMPGKPLFIVAGLGRLHLEMAVDPRDMAEVRLGQTALFAPEGAGGYEASGALVHINPDVDEQTRKVWVHAEAMNPKRLLRPNAFGRGRIKVAEVPDAVVVPESCLQRDGSEILLFVRLSELAFEARRVKTGIRADGVIAVEGVRPGEQVVTTGSHDLLSELRRDQIDASD